MQALHSLSSIKGAFSILLTFVLLFSFGLHAVQISHTHFAVTPHEHGEHHHGGEGKTSLGGVLEVAMHVSDKKQFVIIGLLILSYLLTRQKTIQNLLLSAFKSTQNTHERYGYESRLHNYLSLYFRIGTIHSKAY